MVSAPMVVDSVPLEGRGLAVMARRYSLSESSAHELIFCYRLGSAWRVCGN